MKHKLLSLAVIAATALPVSGVVLAEDQGGPTIYGRIDLGLARTDDGENTAFDVRSNSSRLGIKGEEDLGGLVGFYQYEFQVDTADGDGAIEKGRDQFVGLKGDFGKVYLGRFDTPLKKAQNKADLFSDQVDMKNYIAGEEREGSSIGYSTPDMGGLTLHLQFQPGEEDTDNEGETLDGVADAISVSAVFKGDGVYAALAYDMNVDYSFWADTPFTLGATDRTDALRLVGGVVIDNFGFNGLFQTSEQSDIANPAEQTAFLLSSYVMMDQTKFELQFAQSNHESDAFGAPDVDIDFLGLGAEQHLSKRTMVYGVYGTQTTDVDGAESDDDVILVGAQHKF